MIASPVASSMGIKHMVVESGNRFATNLIVQETGLEWLEENLHDTHFH